jgi:deoxyribonuclease-4
VGAGEAAGLATAAESLHHVLGQARNRVAVLLELTAGQGTSIGHRLEHLAELLGRVTSRRLGVCLDTCHLFAAGYDLRTPAAYEATMAAVDRTVGLEQVRAFHLNDSRGDLGCRCDRHAEIGEGKIGLAAFRRLVRDPRFAALPGVLETPGGLAGSRRNLRRLRLLRRGAHPAVRGRAQGPPTPVGGCP